MFLLQRIVGSAKSLSHTIRQVSSTAPLVDISMDKDGLATVTMQRVRAANSLNLDLLHELNKALHDLSTDKARGMVLTSACPTIFSGGLDLRELYKPDLKRAELSRIALQDLWINLFGSALPTVAAINGHSPAGGCLLALSCEYRVMVAGDYTIGLNEAALGLVAPNFFMDSLSHTISRRQTELALTEGKMFTTEEAFQVGLIDEIASEKEEAIEKSKKFLRKFEKIPPLARSLTKQRFRAKIINDFVAVREQDVKEFLEHIQDPDLQAVLEMYMVNMKKKTIST